MDGPAVSDPAAVLLVAVFAIPLALTAYYSLTDWRGGMRPEHWIGLANYRRALTSDRVLLAISHNAILLVVIPIEVILGAIVASALRSASISGASTAFSSSSPV